MARPAVYDRPGGPFARGGATGVIPTRVDAFVQGLACHAYVVDGATTPFFGGLRAIDHIQPVGNALVSR